MSKSKSAPVPEAPPPPALKFELPPHNHGELRPFSLHWLGVGFDAAIRLRHRPPMVQARPAAGDKPPDMRPLLPREIFAGIPAALDDDAIEAANATAATELGEHGAVIAFLEMKDQVDEMERRLKDAQERLKSIKERIADGAKVSPADLPDLVRQRRDLDEEVADLAESLQLLWPALGVCRSRAVAVAAQQAGQVTSKLRQRCLARRDEILADLADRLGPYLSELAANQWWFDFSQRDATSHGEALLDRVRKAAPLAAVAP